MAKRQPNIATSKTRRCCRCKKRKPREAFPPNRFKRSGVQSYCRECRSTYSTAHQRIYRQENVEQIKDRILQKKYGISMTQFLAMSEAVGHVCEICGNPESNSSRLHVDHCHSTGVVRGLLCSPCNRAIGLLRDDAERARQAAAYLDRTEQKPRPLVIREA